MKDLSIYNRRLMKFAKHLEKISEHPEFGLYDTASFVELKEKEYVNYKIVYHGWLFSELPEVFEEWYFDDAMNNPLYEGAVPEGGTLRAVIDFFNLDREEFCQLFDLEGFQHPKKYGGDYLNFESTGQDIARNIQDLVSSRICGFKSN